MEPAETESLCLEQARDHVHDLPEKLKGSKIFLVRFLVISFPLYVFNYSNFGFILKLRHAEC